jgi:hypothetical protein
MARKIGFMKKDEEIEKSARETTALNRNAERFLRTVSVYLRA